MKRGFVMNSSKELYIVRSQWKDEKTVENSPPPIENDNWMAIYEDIEKILNGKKTSRVDLDIHLLMSRLI